MPVDSKSEETKSHKTPEKNDNKEGKAEGDAG